MYNTTTISIFFIAGFIFGMVFWIVMTIIAVKKELQKGENEYVVLFWFRIYMCRSFIYICYVGFSLDFIPYSNAIKVERR